MKHEKPLYTSNCSQMTMCSVKDQANEEPPPELLQKEFLKTTSAMTWLIDEDDRLIFANPAFLQFLGITEQDLHKKAIDVIPPLFTTIFEKEHRNVRETGVPLKKIYKFPLPNGTTSYYLVDVFPVPNQFNKNLLGGEAFDITFGYNIHEEIARANERLIQLTQVTVEAIWEWNICTGEVLRNEQLMKMIGFEKNSMEGISWWYERIHPADRKHVRASVNRALKNRCSSWQEEYRFQHADGTYKVIRDRGFIVYEKERAVKMIGSLVDVSEIKELKDQLLQEKLRHQREITKSILSAQEIERTKLGQELHDNVNQLLTVANLYLSVLQPADENSQSLLNNTRDVITSAITEIQTMSRAMVIPARQDKDIAAYIGELVSDLKNTKLFHILFSSDIPRTLYIPRGKRIALYRIVQEQIKNIIKYSKAKNIQIYLGYDTHHIRLLVRDDGIGFDPSQNGKGKGKGIGLRNIYDRATLYNGTVELNTSPGKGCEWKVSLPVK